MVGRIAAQQDFAAQTIEVGVTEMLLSLLRNRQTVLDQRQSAVGTPRRGLKLGKQPVIEWRTEPKALVHEGRKLLPEPNRTRLWVEQLSARPMRVNPIEFSNALDP